MLYKARMMRTTMKTPPVAGMSDTTAVSESGWKSTECCMLPGMLWLA